METLKTCPLCGGEASTLLYAREDIRCVVCDSCGLAYLNPRVGAEEWIRFYEESYQKQRHNIPDLEAAIRRAEDPKRYEKKRKLGESFVPYLTSDSRVFEIGAGYGALLAVIRDVTGASVSGIEPGVIGSEVARRVYKIDVETSDVDQYLVSPHEKNDLVIMSHVLEHLGSPKTSLALIKNLLKADGMLWIAVPNILMADEAPRRYFHFEHLYYFSPQTLVRTMEEAGFAVVSLETSPHEMIVRARITPGTSETKINSSACPGGRADVLATYGKYAQKYRVLEHIRRVSETLLPPSIHTFVRVSGAKILRTMGVIQ